MLLVLMTLLKNMILYDVKKDLEMNFMKNMRFILKLEIELSMLKR